MYISELFPSASSKARFYEYFPGHEIKTASSYDAQRAGLRGWLIKVRGIGQKDTDVVVYGESNEVYFDFGRGPKSYSNGTLSIQYRKILNFLFLKFCENGDTVKEFKIYIPVMRYLSSDGMFPKDVEPIYSLISLLEAEHDRIAKELTAGIINGVR